jgi:hypothetical protein
MNERHALRLVVLLVLVLSVVAALAPAAPAAAERTRCGKTTGAAYKGSRSWFVGVDKLTCSAGKALAAHVIPKAAVARKRLTVKSGSFTCFVYPGGAECKGKGGQAFGVASAVYGGG